LEHRRHRRRNYFTTNDGIGVLSSTRVNPRISIEEHWSLIGNRQNVYEQCSNRGSVEQSRSSENETLCDCRLAQLCEGGSHAEDIQEVLDEEMASCDKAL
ncbi:hypothetical protein T4A_10603, partial [Trichinella pseudospiralis]